MLSMKLCNTVLGQWIRLETSKRYVVWYTLYINLTIKLFLVSPVRALGYVLTHTHSCALV